MCRDNYLPIYYSSGRVICQRVMTNGGDSERSRSPRGPPHPLPRVCRSLGPGFLPDIPTSLPVTPDSRFPRRSPRGIGVQHGTSGSRALRASPHARQWLSCPLFPSRSRLLRSHGHVVLPARGVPGSTPGPGDAPALGQPVGCWMPAQPGAPYSCWARVLPGSSALSRRASTIHWPSLPAPLFILL